MPTNLSEVKLGPDVEERNNRILEDVETLLDDKLVSGYAFVIWDAAGKMGTASRIWSGPIGSTMLPTLVHDALLKNVTTSHTIQEIEQNENK